MSMFKLTTPIHSFVMNVNPSYWTEFRITYKQDTSIVLEKTEADLSSMMIEEVTEGESWKLSYQLTQEETALFRPKIPIRIQIRVLFQNGTVAACEEIKVSIYDVLNHEILGA